MIDNRLCVYLVLGAGRVKIEKTIDTDTRFRALQACSPVVLEPFAAWGFNEPTLRCPAGTNYEKVIHRRQRLHRVHGEWFNDVVHDFLLHCRRYDVPRMFVFDALANDKYLEVPVLKEREAKWRAAQQAAVPTMSAL